ncbi:aspartyl/asparaginyl beta-hydroxylase isoform X18 [Mus pahari]|uniref:aspartyl/asparaginyl beta-hydroxylase isoform X18 n=1 Tax=Mus pahari TaxID=10093 RepID=UPI000A30E95B|nr:aspartyl/asparaginyl beta-hydroxylase isoform X18 [Mus pahari]
MAEDKEAKHGGHKNGRRGGISGGSFFTWFMVIALLGVWTSVAVVWFDLVDYEEVLGKLGVYDADGDGDFDVDDAKVLLEGPGGLAKRKTKAKGLKERSPSERTFPPEEEAETQAEPEERGPEGADLEADGPTGDPQPEVEDFLTVTDSDDRFEDLEPGTDHEEIEDSYHVEETASPNHLNEVEEIANEQEDSDPSEAVTDADVLQPHAEEVRHQDYEEPVYEPSEHERIEISDIAVDDSSTISEEINVASVEEQQDTPPDT